MDLQLPAWPIASPDGDNVAYLTWLKTPRLKVLALKTGSVRDLGAALIDCAPAWSDKDHVWTVQASERGRDWIEIDVRTGERTGRQRPAGGDGQADSPSCWLDQTTSPNPYPRVRVVGRESSEIRAMQSPEWL